MHGSNRTIYLVILVGIVASVSGLTLFWMPPASEVRTPAAAHGEIAEEPVEVSPEVDAAGVSNKTGAQNSSLPADSGNVPSTRPLDVANSRAYSSPAAMPARPVSAPGKPPLGPKIDPNPRPATSISATVGAAASPIVQGPASPGGGNELASATSGDFVVPVGAVLPASVVDEASEATPEKTKMLDAMSEDFLNEVVGVPPAAGSAEPAEGARPVETGEWNRAASDANERYRATFGVDAFNRWSTQAAVEAIAEAKASAK